MKNKIKNIVNISLGLSIIAGAIWGVYIIFATTWEHLSKLDSTLSTGIIAASTTVIVSVISILISKHLETKTLTNNSIREKKIPIYEKIINFIFKIAFADKLGQKPPSEKEMIEFFTETTRTLVVWGSNDMIRAFSKFREGAVEKSPNEILFVVEDLMFAIRKDLGHEAKKLKRGDILRLYVNDIDQHL